MPSGQLTVTPVTIKGLPSDGHANYNTFFGCYVVPNEKQRTPSVYGPEPQWNHPLTCNIPEGYTTMIIEIVNEDPSHPGVLGGASVDLSVVFQQGRVEQWVPIVSVTGELVGHAFIHLNFPVAHGAQDPYALPPAYSGPPGYPQEKGEAHAFSAFAQEGAPPPSYGADAGSSDAAHERQEGEKAKKIPDWVKYGGAALAGTAAIGLSAWAAHEIKEKIDEKDKKSDKQQGLYEMFHTDKKDKKDKKHKKSKKDKHRRGSHSGSSSDSSDSD